MLTVGDAVANGQLPPEAVAPARTPYGGTQAGQRTALRFFTPAELRQNIPTAPPWLWENYIAEGFITVVGGRPKAGKSTLIYTAIDKLVQGEREFAGASLRGGSNHVVVVSEEHAITALDKLRDTKRLHVLTRDEAFPKPSWDDMLADALAEVRRTHARLLLIDSFTFWAGLDAEQGQDSSAVQKRLNALVELAREGVAVVLIHHQRKDGGEFGDALLGSTAFSANADIIVEVERLGEGGPTNYRRVMRAARWHSKPGTVLSWTKDGGYVHVGEVESAAEADDLGWVPRLLEVLPADGSALRASSLPDLIGANALKWGRAMASLEAEGRVVKTGAGGAKDPFEYHLNTAWTKPPSI